MDAIEQIIKQINEDAANERAAFETAERKNIEQVFKQKSEQVTTTFQQQERKQLESLERHYRQLENRQQVEARQDMLNQKQAFLDKLFDEAIEKMEAWKPQDVLAFVQTALSPLALKGEVIFRVGEKSADIFTEEQIKDFSQKLSFTLVKDPKVIPNEAGFVLDSKGIQYNFLFSRLVTELRGSMGYELAQQLFT